MGDQLALERPLALAERYDLEDSADEAEHELGGADQEIIERFKERVVREHEAENAEDGKRQEPGS